MPDQLWDHLKQIFMRRSRCRPVRAFVSTRASSSSLLYPGVDYSLLGGDIWVMPALGGSARRIAESGNFLSWLPDGSTINYMRGTAWFQPKMRRVSAGRRAAGHSDCICGR